MSVVVLGGGVSGAHAALTLLERGYEVELWDVGREERAFSHAGTTFHELKGRLDDPAHYFLGNELEALIPPAVPDLIAFPPSRDSLITPKDPLWSYRGRDFHPAASLSRGGLANAWGANALAFDADDISGWPISEAELHDAYARVFGRVRVAGPTEDELTPHLRGVTVSQPPVPLSRADEVMLRTYRRKSASLAKLGVVVGRARMAVTTDPGLPEACDRCDRCLWGCPRGSIYNPRTSTLAACEAFARFAYKKGRLAISLVAEGERITGIRYLDTDTNELREAPCASVFLAAGALQSGGIFLRTLKAARPDLGSEGEGLMDTHMVKLPYLAVRSIGTPVDERAFQFNRLILGVVMSEPSWPRYLHGEMLHLTSLVYHPLIERMPFDTRLSKKLFFALRSALGVVSLFFPDKLTPGNRQVLVEDPARGWDRVELRYAESAEKERYVTLALARVKRALWKLGCVPQPAVRMPSGAAIHYAGTIPMGEGPKRCDRQGRANLFRNLFIADGAAFPSLPSKSITMSLAAHATRVARLAEV